MTCPIFYARYYDEKITNTSGKASDVSRDLREVFFYPLQIIVLIMLSIIENVNYFISKFEIIFL